MAGSYPPNVWVEVSTELLDELGEWTGPVLVRVDKVDPAGRAVMVFQDYQHDLRADLALALRLLDGHTWPPDQVPCRFDHHGGCQEHGFLSLEPGEKCPNQEAHELLVRQGIRKGAE